METKQTLIYVTLAVAVLIVSMIVYAVGARKNRWTIKWNAGQILFLGWFMLFGAYMFMGPSEEPRYFEANLDVKADGRGICAVPVAGLYPRDLLILARAGLGANSDQPIEIELEVKSNPGGAVALISKDRLMPDRGGQWEQIKKTIRPMVEGDHVLIVKTSPKVGTVQVKVEY